MRGIVPKTEANLLMHSDLWDEREGGMSRMEVVSYCEAAKPNIVSAHKKLKMLKGHSAHPPLGSAKGCDGKQGDLRLLARVRGRK